MPTPMHRAKRAGAATEAIVKERLMEAYADQFLKFKADLKSRMKLKSFNMPFGGGPNPEYTAAKLNLAIGDLKKRIFSMSPVVVSEAGEIINPEYLYHYHMKLDPKALARNGLAVKSKGVLEKIGGDLDEKFLKDSEEFLDAVAKSAPAWVLRSTPGLATRYKTYLKTGSLIEKKLLENAYVRGGIHSQHARLFETTRKYLTASLDSGKSALEVLTGIEKGVWGIDHTAYGAVFPKFHGANHMMWIKRLLATEYNFAHSTSRHDIGQADPRIIGYYILLDDTACDDCKDEYGGQAGEAVYHEYGKGEPLTPPRHPWCHCDVSGFKYDNADFLERNKQALEDLDALLPEVA